MDIAPTKTPHQLKLDEMIQASKVYLQKQANQANRPGWQPWQGSPQPHPGIN